MSPGPRTRSSSPMPVENVYPVWEESASLTEKLSAGLIDTEPPDFVLAVFKNGVASVRVFHSWQAGH